MLPVGILGRIKATPRNSWVPNTWTEMTLDPPKVHPKSKISVMEFNICETTSHDRPKKGNHVIHNTVHPVIHFSFYQLSIAPFHFVCQHSFKSTKLYQQRFAILLNNHNISQYQVSLLTQNMERASCLQQTRMMVNTRGCEH